MEIVELLKIAQPQYGCATRTQALEVMTPSQFAYLVKTGTLVRAWPSTYLVAGTASTWHQRALAVVLSIRQAVLSHHSAAKLWGLTFAESNQLEITTPGTRLFRRKHVSIHRSQQLSTHTTTHDGIPTTTVARTIVDMSEYMTSKQLGALLDQARILKLARPTDVEACLSKMITKGRLRVSGLREALQPRLKYDKDIDSFLERRTLQWIRANVFPEPITQVWNRTGTKPYRLDIVYPELKIDIEPDGPHHLLQSIALSDRKRDAELVIRGWIVIRVPLEMEEHEFVGILQSAFATRSSGISRRRV